jgi:hypothetical protein
MEITMNIDFTHHAAFSSYALLLMFSGVVVLVFASPAFRRASTLLRALNAVIGLAMLGYGFYLIFLFKGGHYVVFFQAFIVPVLLIINTIRNSSGRGRSRYSTPMQGFQQWSAQPGGSHQTPVAYSSPGLAGASAASSGSRHAAVMEEPNPPVRLGSGPRESAPAGQSGRVASSVTPAYSGLPDMQVPEVQRSDVQQPSSPTTSAPDASGVAGRYVPPRPRTPQRLGGFPESDADTGPIPAIVDEELPIRPPAGPGYL